MPGTRRILSRQVDIVSVELQYAETYNPFPTGSLVQRAKADAVAENVIGEIYARFVKAGLRIIAARMLHLTREQAEGYHVLFERLERWLVLR